MIEIMKKVKKGFPLSAYVVVVTFTDRSVQFSGFLLRKGNLSVGISGKGEDFYLTSENNVKIFSTIADAKKTIRTSARLHPIDEGLEFKILQLGIAEEVEVITHAQETK